MNSGDRVRLLHQENQGLIASLSRGIDEARGAFIARMDGDDISASERFERHVEFLNANGWAQRSPISTRRDGHMDSSCGRGRYCLEAAV
ncbi:glycosyltransferase [Salinibacter grassmerensis]|uniref:glycosyltransferase n=1 Tax=Salinibacter grassmerensis TaxID=3040353 RepID=UPI003C6DF28A